MPLYNLNLSVREWDIQDTVGVTYTEAVFHEPYAIADGETNTSIPLGGVATGASVYIKSDQAISVKFNTTGNAALSILANKPLFISGTAVTAIYITNASGSTANVYVYASE